MDTSLKGLQRTTQPGEGRADSRYRLDRQLIRYPSTSEWETGLVTWISREYRPPGPGKNPKSFAERRKMAVVDAVAVRTRQGIQGETVTQDDRR